MRFLKYHAFGAMTAESLQVELSLSRVLSSGKTGVVTIYLGIRLPVFSCILPGN